MLGFVFLVYRSLSVQLHMFHSSPWPFGLIFVLQVDDFVKYEHFWPRFTKIWSLQNNGLRLISASKVSSFVENLRSTDASTFAAANDPTMNIIFI